VSVFFGAPFWRSAAQLVKMADAMVVQANAKNRGETAY
jgi:hypothetical protein